MRRRGDRGRRSNSNRAPADAARRAEDSGMRQRRRGPISINEAKAVPRRAEACRGALIIHMMAVEVGGKARIIAPPSLIPSCFVISLSLRRSVAATAAVPPSLSAASCVEGRRGDGNSSIAANRQSSGATAAGNRRNVSVKNESAAASARSGGRVTVIEHMAIIIVVVSVVVSGIGVGTPQSICAATPLTAAGVGAARRDRRHNEFDGAGSGGVATGAGGTAGPRLGLRSGRGVTKG